MKEKIKKTTNNQNFKYENHKTKITRLKTTNLKFKNKTEVMKVEEIFIIVL